MVTAGVSATCSVTGAGSSKVTAGASATYSISGAGAGTSMTIWSPICSMMRSVNKGSRCYVAGRVDTSGHFFHRFEPQFVFTMLLLARVWGVFVKRLAPTTFGAITVKEHITDNDLASCSRLSGRQRFQNIRCDRIP